MEIQSCWNTAQSHECAEVTKVRTQLEEDNLVNFNCQIHNVLRPTFIKCNSLNIIVLKSVLTCSIIRDSLGRPVRESMQAGTDNLGRASVIIAKTLAISMASGGN